jgi:transglutaminase-like putative cysteine protease
MRRPVPEDVLSIRIAMLGTVLVAMVAIGVHEEFSTQALVAAMATATGFFVSYHRRRARNWWIKLILALLIIVVARDFFRSLVINPYDPRIPLVRLFLWLQALHSFDLPARKDLKYSLASAVILMAVAGVYARDPAFGAYLIPFVLLATGALVAMAAHPQWEDQVRLERASPALMAGSAAAIGVLVLLIGTVIFAAIPRGEGFRVRWLPVSPRIAFRLPLYDRILNPAYPETGEQGAQTPPVFNPQGYVGFSTNVDLRLRGVLDDTVVLRVRATRPAFWRGLAFDEYTGTSWRMSDRTVEQFSSTEPRIVPRYSPDEPWPAGSEQVVQTFYVEAQQPNVVFGAYRVTEVFFPASEIGVDRYAGLRSPVPLETGIIYSVISRVPAPAPGVLQRNDTAVPDAIRERYLALPSIPRRVRDLAAQLTQGDRSAFDRVVAINRYLVERYRYNLQAPSLPAGDDAVDYFLFESRQGSCETFASAMVIMLRAAGIPARLVTGYTSGSYNLLTGYYEVRNSDAHAWVEAFIPRAGWIEFEPTPGFVAPDAAAADARGQWLVRDAWTWINERIAQALSGLGPFGWPHGTGTRTDILWSTIAALLGGLIVVRRRPILAGAGNGVFAAYSRMLSALERAGISRHSSQTPREFVDRMPAAIQGEAELITEAFEVVRYSPHASSAGAAIVVREALGSLLRSLRGPQGRSNLRWSWKQIASLRSR